MSERVFLENISVVLKQPRFPENIGAAARAMSNMGLSHLVIVDPENFEMDKIRKMATHKAEWIVRQAVIVPDMREALKDFTYVAGTSARLGKQRLEFDTPNVLARKLVTISKHNQAAIVFGPEDRGLTNEDLHLCNSLVHIPTAEFSSINLAQSVMILCYEIYCASLESGNTFEPRLAKVVELEGMYAQLKEILVKIKFENPQNADYWINRFRKFFTRIPVRAKEVQLIRGMLKQINRFGESKYIEGRMTTGEDEMVIREEDMEGSID